VSGARARLGALIRGREHPVGNRHFRREIEKRLTGTPVRV
jgi:hypothetical protein